MPDPYTTLKNIATESSDLVIVGNQAGLAEDRSIELMSNFALYYAKAKDIAAGAKDIVVTDESQKELILKAKEARKAIRDVRLDVEETRKTLKEGALREGKAIDGIANVIKALIVPVEQHLEIQEKFAEVREMKRLQDRYEDRVARLSVYVADVSIYQLKDMADATFDRLLDGAKAAHEAQIQAEKQAEQDRIKRQEKLTALHNRQMELAPYMQYNVSYILTEDTTDLEYQEMKHALVRASKEAQTEQEKIRKENEALRLQAEKDRKAVADAEAKLKQEREEQARKAQAEKVKADAEYQARVQAEAKVLAEAEEEKRKALVAPDKEKLMELARAIIAIELPAVQSNEADAIIRATKSMIDKLTAYIFEGAKKL